MTRLALIQAEILEVTRRLADNIEDGREYPSIWNDIQPAREVLQLRLQNLRQEERILIANRVVVARDPAPFRQNATVERDVSNVVYWLLVVLVVGVSTAMMLHAADLLVP